MKINVRQGNALDLSSYQDNTFDVTLCLGPLYHLFSEEDRRKAIEEAIRVTKKKGIIYFAYITNDAVILSYCLRKGNLNRISEICDEKFKLKDIPEEIFSVNQEHINKLTEEEYEIWIKYHLSICEREDLMGYSNHILYICEKQ